MQYLQHFDGSIINNKFAFKFLGTKSLRIGNILIFSSETFKYDISTFKNVLHICWEIPDISNISNVLFKKLFIIQISNILSQKYEIDLHIDLNDNILEKKYEDLEGILKPVQVQKSVHMLNMVGNTGLGFISLINTDENPNDYVEDITNCLYKVLDNSFTESFKF